MLIVTKGWVTHNGISYGRGQALPKMKRADELRLLDPGTCVEGDIPILGTATKEETPPPITGDAGGEGQATNAGLDLNFDPDANIKSKT